MKFFRFLGSKTFWANLILALLFGGAILWGTAELLDRYTRHGKTITVPDLSRLALSEAEERLAKLNLEHVVMDSSEFDPGYPRGSVVNQYPAPGREVKLGREIRLTLNPLKPRKIALPDIIEKTRRRAIYDLESKGLAVGELEYVPYIGKDVVVDIKYEGKSVPVGKKLEKGSVIDLVLGEGVGDTKIRVPYLRWLTLDEAESELKSRSLNVGAIVYDEEIRDSSLALVYRQSPPPSTTEDINLGEEVDVWLTNDHTKIPGDSLDYQFIEDTTAISAPHDTI